jgi:hypothetical protein
MFVFVRHRLVNARFDSPALEILLVEEVKITLFIIVVSSRSLPHTHVSTLGYGYAYVRKEMQRGVKNDVRLRDMSRYAVYSKKPFLVFVDFVSFL